MKCEICHQTVLDPKNAWTGVEGWEHHRDEGGTNHVALRRPTNKVMHNGCMEKLQNGIAVGQEMLG